MIDGRRNRGLVRCLKLRRLLEPLLYRPHLDELAAHFKVTPRTIRRDLKALHAAGEKLPRYRQDKRDGEFSAC